MAGQEEIFKLANSACIQLIFDINSAFSRRRFPVSRITDDAAANHDEFVRTWKEDKLLELNAIEIGDRDLAVLAARYSRKVWHRRVWMRFAFANELEMAR